MEQIGIITAMFQQITGSPAFVYILIFVNMVIFAWEAVPQLPSRIIPLVSIALGGVLYPCFVSPGSVSPDFPNPVMVLVTNGLFAGLISFAFHRGFVFGLRKLTGWPPVDSEQPQQKPTEEGKTE